MTARLVAPTIAATMLCAAPCFAQAPGPQAPFVPPAYYPPVAVPGPQPGVVRMRIVTTDARVQLRVSRGSSSTFSLGGVGGVGPSWSSVTFSDTLCRAPCGAIIDGRLGEEFFFAGVGVPRSAAFQLIDKRGDVTVRVDPGSKAQRVGGIVAIAIGGAASAAGIIALALGTASRDDSRGGLIAGAIAAPLGGVTMISGIVALATSGTTFEFLPRSR